MADNITVYGKTTCPYTKAALEAFKAAGKDVTYIDVVADPEKLEEMLSHSKGVRKVPVIIEEGDISVGFRGKG